MAHGFVRDMVEAKTGKFRLQLGICLTGGIVLINSYVAGLLFELPELSVFISLAAAILLGTPLVYNALKDLWLNRVEMNELAALSFVASFGSGQYQIAALIALFLVGSELIEYRSQLGARKNIEALLKLTPHRAFVQTKKGFQEIDAIALKIGDVVQVKPGERIPGDGKVVSGLSAVDQSAITGESVPVEKRPDDVVFGGTINQTGVLTIRITTHVKDSTFARIQMLITQAEESRTPVMRLIDRYVSWYTPIILMCAAIVLFFTHDMNRAIAMLVVACPCTIILSTPTALVAALSAAARLGVVIKNINTLEVASSLNTLIFDKTGTLTAGRLAVTGIVVNGKVSDANLLSVAASLEQYSTHPVAKAIVAETYKRNLSFQEACDVSETPGFGICGTVDGAFIAVGRKEWIEHRCTESSKFAVQQDGATCLYVAQNSHMMGTIQLSDTVRPDAKKVIDHLQAQERQHVIILTGDRHTVAERIAAQLACEVESEVLPDEKMARVKEARQRGAVVGVVGDGVNDAPALAAGDISIAMGAAGSDVAIHSAAIVLMNDKLDRIPFIIKLSRRVVVTIRQNLILSTFYILTLFGLSASGMISPVLAVILHTSSALFVVFNSARLMRVGEELS